MQNGKYLYISLFKLKEDVNNLLDYLFENECPDRSLIGKFCRISDVLEHEFKNVDSLISEGVCKSSTDKESELRK